MKRYEIQKYGNEPDVFRLTIQEHSDNYPAYLGSAGWLVTDIIEGPLRFVTNWMLKNIDPETKIGVRKVKV